MTFFAKFGFYLLLIFSSLSTSSGHAEPNDPKNIHEVVMIGHGETLQEARNDAIRQALQQTMQQLIVVDRVIQDDKITRDKIMSTMNGYIDHFKEMRTFEENGQIAVEAKIAVSSSRITNFIGTIAGKAATLSGSSMLAESQRMVAQRKVLGEILDRLFVGYPSDVIDLTITGIKIDDQSPDTLNVNVKINYSKLWLEQLYSGLAALSIDHASSGNCPNKCDQSWYISKAQSNLQESRWKKTKPTEGSYTDIGHTEFCMEYDGRGECFMLPTGEYTKTLLLDDDDRAGPMIRLSIRFVDENGNSTFTDKSKCKFVDHLGSGMRPLRAGIHSEKIHSMGSHGWQYKDHTRLALNPLDTEVTFKIKTSDIDLTRTAKLGAVVIFGGLLQTKNEHPLSREYTFNYGIPGAKDWFTVSNIAGSISSQSDVCGEKLDDVIRWMK